MGRDDTADCVVSLPDPLGKFWDRVDRGDNFYIQEEFDKSYMMQPLNAARSSLVSI